MMTSQIDYMAVFQNLPSPVLLLTPDFIIADMNLAYQRVAGRKREDLLGRNIFAAFPDNPSEPGSTGTHNLSASLRRVLATGDRDSMPLQKYDVEVPGSPGAFEERYWSPVNAPVFGSDGRVVLIAHWVEEVSDLVRQFAAAQAANV